jgi:mxaA protein
MPIYLPTISTNTWQPKLMSIFMRTRFLLALCALSMATQAVYADVILPDVNPKYVSLKQINPSRDAGYVVGDVLDRTIILNVKKPYELVKESLPIEGYEHRYRGQISGIELIKISHQESASSEGVNHELQLRYQVFTTGKLAKPAALRAEIVKLRNTNSKEIVQYRIPSYSFRISPLSVFGAVKLKEEMSPFVPALFLDDQADLLQLSLAIAALSLSLLGLLYILGVHAWLPRMGAPFAKAYRDIRKMPDNEAGIQEAATRLHAALNKTAGGVLFNSNLDQFLKNKPAYAPLKQELERFFSLSSMVFFAPVAHTHLGISPKLWLQQFSRQLRDCERGLLPNVKSKASQ